MRIDTTTTNQNVALAASTDSAKASLDYNSFLKLLTEQLKNQDPTDPVDQTETLAQLAAFSNVEQSIKLNDKLTLLLQQSGLGQSVPLIGRTIESLTDGTVGTVKSVELVGEDLMAVLDSGKRIDINAGIRIS